MRARFYGFNDEAGHVLAFGVKSFSRTGKIHECTIDITTGECFCICEDAHYRRNKAKPSIENACCHIRQVLKEVSKIERDSIPA